MSLATHQDYFATTTPEARALLEQIQAEIERVVPGAERCISYQMPAFRKGKVFLYFAAFKKHIGVYPPVTSLSLDAELTPYRGPKGNLIFPLDRPVPIDLIGRCAVALEEQHRK
jgi:uncharacterized protein YdhG (YjbR/CyaY superfamily)